MKIKAVILRNELDDDHLHWIKACENFQERIDYRVVNLTSNSWLAAIQNEPFDVLLAKPGGLTAPFKQVYDERIYILGVVLGYKIFPAPLEIFLYENKRFLAAWLKASRIPHPETRVFYNYNEAREYILTADYPFVAKTNIGASGSGVTILTSISEAESYIDSAYKGKGALQRTGPNLEVGGLLKRGIHYIFNPLNISRKIKIYNTVAANLQKGFVIFQDYVPHDFEWRVVRIGESYFAHKKLKKGEKASGSLLKLYDNPPLQLLDFVKNITDKHHLYSQAIDIFESGQGYLVNEMQCIFGQSDPYQMLVYGQNGRYKFKENGWSFEKGDFAINACYDLRIEFVLEGFK